MNISSCENSFTRYRNSSNSCKNILFVIHRSNCPRVDCFPWENLSHDGQDHFCQSRRRLPLRFRSVQQFNLHVPFRAVWRYPVPPLHGKNQSNSVVYNGGAGLNNVGVGTFQPARCLSCDTFVGIGIWQFSTRPFLHNTRGHYHLTANAVTCVAAVFKKPSKVNCLSFLLERMPWG